MAITLIKANTYQVLEMSQVLLSLLYKYHSSFSIRNHPMRGSYSHFTDAETEAQAEK